MSDIVGTLRALLGTDNASRNAAEQCFQDAKKQTPAATIAALFQAVAEQQLEEPVREQAAVLLRQCLSKVRDEGSPWSSLGEAGHADCKAKVLQLLEAEPTAKVRSKVADIIQSLGNQLIDLEENARPQNAEAWPELMPTLMRIVMDSAKADGLRADALWTVKELLTSIWPIFVANSNNTATVLKASFASPADAIKAAAGQLLCELVDNLEKKDSAAFAPLIEDLCNALKHLASGAETKHCNNLLQSLQGSSNSANFFKDSMAAGLLPVLSTIAKSHKEEETQKLALEALVSIAEGKPKAIAKVPGFVPQVLEVAVSFLMHIGDDVDAWAQEDDDEAEDEDLYTNGKEVIDRLSRCMASNDKFPLVMETLKPAIANLFSAGSWKPTIAGLAVMSQIAEFVDDEATILQMLGAVQAQLRAENPRVRHAAWSAVAQFAEDHGEAVTTEALAAQLLPAFLAGLDDSCQRVQVRCMEAFQVYGSEVEREVIEPFVQPMMANLGHKLQSSPLPVQKKTITFIAVLAGQMEDGFAQYYGPLMPVLKSLVQTLLHKSEERMLLGKTLECISLLAASVGTEGFKGDAEGIMQIMIQATQVPNLPSNDPVKEYMLEASQRICATMKGDFLPFVPHILPGILEKFTLSPKEYNQDTIGKFADEDEVNLSITEENGKIKVMIMSTSEVEDLQNAVACVHTFVEELGKMYAPFVAQTAHALLLVFDFSMAEEIRNMAFETWGLLCEAAREGGQGDVLGQLVHEFLKRILPKFENVSGEAATMDQEGLKTAADGVTVCLKKAGGGILSAEQVGHICKVAFETLGASLKVRDADEQCRKATRSADEEDGEKGDDNEEEGVNLRIACCEMVGALMQHHADIFMAECLSLCMQLVAQFIPTTSRWEDRRLAIFVCCDMLEHLGARITPQWPQFMPQMLQDVLHQSPAIRQPACYGTSLAAKDPAFAPMAQSAASSLSQLVKQTRSGSKKKSERPAQACADNALSALAEIAMTHQQTVAAAEAEIWGVWLDGLPCQADEEEGIKNHRTLLRLVQAEKPQILGDGGARLPQVLSILVDVYKTPMADQDTSKGIGQLVVSIGEQRLEQLAQQLKEKQRKKLLRIHREAQ